MLHFLGRGSIHNYKEGHTAAFYKYDNGKSMLLIDCGETVPQSIIELELLKGVENLNIAITHTHPDHIGGLGSLIYYCKWQLELVPNIMMVGSRTFSLLLTSYLASVGVNESWITVSECKHPIVKYMHLRHADYVINYAYILDINDRTVVYTGDTCDLTGLKFIYDTYPDALFYTDCSIKETGVHIKLDDLCSIFPEEVRKNVYCMHFDNNETINTAHSLGFRIVHNLFKTKINRAVLDKEWHSMGNKEYYAILYKEHEEPFYMFYDLDTNEKLRLKMNEVILQI